MRVLLCVLLAACALAQKTNDNRHHKLPFVADAVGNSLPPPSSVPATVGSPVNLLTPDRYEFYTFDESGELVKRLMTLEEIQAIVAAGEESEGLVTFANENQPTIAFNFSQPSHTKVHSVVTNVQNVLKAQMEAHKNKPLIQPTLDTPDVSDSWSLILPSIFGNTGVDIVPDKSSGTFTTPETETLEIDGPLEVDDNLLSKDLENQTINVSTTTQERVAVTEKMPPKNEVKEVSTIVTTSTTPKPLTSSTTTITPVISTTTKKSTSTTSKPTTTTQRLVTKATTKLRTTTTTKKPSPSIKPIVKTTTKTTTAKPITTTIKVVTNTSAVTDAENSMSVQIQPNSNTLSSTEKNEMIFEKISTFIPVSTIKYVKDRFTTAKPITSIKFEGFSTSTTKKSVPPTTKAPFTQISTNRPSFTTSKPAISTSNYISTTFKDPESEKNNMTTITTQSVSPSTTVSSTEVISVENLSIKNTILENKLSEGISNNENEPLMPTFDVAQSISQIASDLGNNYQPIPTTSDLLDTTQMNVSEFESKENFDLDIPSATGNETELNSRNTTSNIQTNTTAENFVKISTLDPQEEISNKETKTQGMIIQKNRTNILLHSVQKIEVTTLSTEETTVDPILSESMGDLLSQVVNQNLQTLADLNDSSIKDEIISTTEKILDTTTVENWETTSEVSIKFKKESTSSTTESQVELETIKELNPSSAVVSAPNKETTSSTTESQVELETIKELDPSSVVVSAHNRTEEKVADDKNMTVTNSVVLPHNRTRDEVSYEGNSKKPVQSSKTNDSDHESLANKEANDKDQNFIQITMFSDKNETKKELLAVNKPTISIIPLTNTSNKAIESLSTVSKEQIEPDGVNNAETVSIETTTLSYNENIPTTTIESINENKFPPSKINKINAGDKVTLSNKKDKVTEPSPKIDDFKKKIQKVNIDEEELLSKRNNSWKLIPTLSPPKANEIPKDKLKSENHYTPENENKDIVLEYSQENQGLEVTTKDLGYDIAQFSELCNELAFRYWNVMVENIDKKRSFILSPYSITSMLAMMFMGARGSTSGEMNEILKLDDMVTFNPHFTLKNISDSIDTSTNSGVVVSAFIRELYSDRTKGKILTFYKERAQHFYNGHVEEINFKLISDIIRRRTNLLVKRYTWGKIAEYMKTNNIVMQPPLAAFSANIFQTDCTGTSVDGRDGEMYFVVSPNVRQRRLVPVPAVVYKSGFLAGYDPVLDATAAALGNTNSVVSTLFLMPGQQGNVVHADDLEKLETRLLDSNPTTPMWSRLLRSLLPRTGLELQIPRFSHKSIFNVSSTLQKMGLKDIFDAEHADLGGLNGPSKDLYLSDMIQLSSFATCGEGVIGDQHHIEEYPETLGMAKKRRSSRWANDWDEPRDYQRAFHDPHDVGDAMHLPLHLRPRQARLPSRSAQPARLKYDRPFLYFVRHNPSGMILYFGRYNPRLLP